MNAEAIVAICALAVTLLLALVGATWHLSTKIGDIKTLVKVNIVEYDNLRSDVDRHDTILNDHAKRLQTVELTTTRSKSAGI